MLKIAVISDTHLGFTPLGREKDPLNNCKQAFQKAFDEQVDLILIPGDIFHEKIPKQEILGEAIELFSSVKRHMGKEAKLLISKTKDTENKPNQKIPPIISIYGTHERRYSESINPVHLLEKAGLLYNLHAESILLELKGDQIGIHGLSGVPENYAKQTLTAWMPKPFKDIPNILMIHQNFKELIPELDSGYMELSDLPKGFDMFLLGHVHWNMELQHPLTNAPVLVPGSTIKTQLTAKESERKKGIYIINIGRQKGSIKFIPLETRPLYYHKIKVEKETTSNILKNISKQINKDIKDSKTTPLIRIKIEGSLHEKHSPVDINLKKILDEYKDKAILSIDKSKLQSSSLTKRSDLLLNLKDNKISIEEFGLKILQENLKTPIDPKKLETIFNLLAEQNIKDAEPLIPKKQSQKDIDTKKERKQSILEGQESMPVAKGKKLTTLEHF